MPILNVKVSAAESPELTRRIGGLLGELTQSILGKDPRLTAIVIDYIDPARWIVAGVPLSEQGRRSVFVEIRITDETNTKAEKARYVEAVFAGFRDLLGDLHEESYVHVHDVRAASYGYGGRTQEYRYQHP